MDKKPTKEAAAVAKLANQILDIVEKADTHRQALQAVMLVYTAIAENHPCCTGHAAGAAINVAKHLTRCAAGRPADAAVH